MPELILSASSLSAYDDCHYRWFLTYVENHSGQQSVAAAVGQGVHAAVEAHYKAWLADEAMSPKELQEVFDTTYLFETLSIDEPEFPIDKAKGWGRAVLTSYLEDVAPTVEPLLVEHGFLLEVNGILVSGHLDLADRAGVVRDLKVKAAKPRDPGVYLRAMTIYALGYRDHTGETETDIQLDVMIRLKRDRPYHVPISNDGPISDRDIGVLAASLEHVANRIAVGDYQPTGLETGACKYCPVKAVCEYYVALTVAS